MFESKLHTVLYNGTGLTAIFLKQTNLSEILPVIVNLSEILLQFNLTKLKLEYLKSRFNHILHGLLLHPILHEGVYLTSYVTF